MSCTSQQVLPRPAATRYLQLRNVWQVDRMRRSPRRRGEGCARASHAVSPARTRCEVSGVWRRSHVHPGARVWRPVPVRFRCRVGARSCTTKGRKARLAATLPLPASESFGEWIACDMPAAKAGMMPELPMRFHPLAAEAKCPACGADLTFMRVRGHGDLYQCASGGPCRCKVLHYRSKATKTCGYAAIYTYGLWRVDRMRRDRGEGMSKRVNTSRSHPHHERSRGATRVPD